MFFQKKDSQSKTKGSIKKIDTLITGIILGGVVASIYGIKKQSEKIEQSTGKKHSIGQIIKMLILGVPKEKKKDD